MPPPKASRGEKVAVVSPSFAAPGVEDQIQVVAQLDPAPVRADPKPFCGYSDNTNLLSWLWTHGVVGFHGGSTQVHLGPGPAVDACHSASLRAALLTGERLEGSDPGESEDFGKDWADPAALDGAVLILETSEEIIPARKFGWILRSPGERGALAAAGAVLVARPPASACHSGTPGPNGSCLTAAGSPSTAARAGSGPTTPETHSTPRPLAKPRSSHDNGGNCGCRWAIATFLAGSVPVARPRCSWRSSDCPQAGLPVALPCSWRTGVGGP
ncbi:MAG: LD-carboxypeptidase [Mycobacteriales bacterium]